MSDATIVQEIARIEAEAGRGWWWSTSRPRTTRRGRWRVCWWVKRGA